MTVYSFDILTVENNRVTDMLSLKVNKNIFYILSAALQYAKECGDEIRVINRGVKIIK